MRSAIFTALLFAVPSVASAQTSSENLNKLAKSALSDDFLIAFVRLHGFVDTSFTDDLIAQEVRRLGGQNLASLQAPVAPERARIGAPSSAHLEWEDMSGNSASATYLIRWCRSHYRFDQCGYSSYDQSVRRSASYRGCSPSALYPSIYQGRSHRRSHRRSTGRIASRLKRVGW